MNKLNLVLILLLNILISSCSKDDNTIQPTITADFETEIFFGENQAIVSLTNLSQNATTYEWSTSSGTIENPTDKNTSIV